MVTRLKIGVGKYVEWDMKVKKLKLTPRHSFIKFIRCICEGRFKIEGIYTRRACFYQGYRRIKAKCLRCELECEMWLAPDGSLLLNSKEVKQRSQPER